MSLNPTLWTKGIISVWKYLPFPVAAYSCVTGKKTSKIAVYQNVNKNSDTTMIAMGNKEFSSNNLVVMKQALKVWTFLV